MKASIHYSGKTILICPLDWGFGHAARCVPLIKHLQGQNNRIIIGCTDRQKKFLQGEVEDVEYTELFGYNVRYSKTLSLGLKLLLQFPRLSSVVKREHRWLHEFLKKNKVEVIISDNRFGLYNKSIESVFITHQLFVPAPFLKGFVTRINLSFIKRFDTCWVPDLENEENSLSGKLSHGEVKLKSLKYIGPLSRFEKRSLGVENKFDVLILLSGVEPQRTLLEEKLTALFSNTTYSVALVRGVETKTQKKFPDNFSIYNTVNTKVLESLFASSRDIICRSGYSTLMDLHALGLKALMIPTPGQTEQEYLADYWKEKFGFGHIDQNALSAEGLSAFLRLKETVSLQ